MMPVGWQTSNATIHAAQDSAKSALDQAMLHCAMQLSSLCSTRCDEMQPESTPLELDNQLSVELVHMGMQDAQSP